MTLGGSKIYYWQALGGAVVKTMTRDLDVQKSIERQIAEKQIGVGTKDEQEFAILSSKLDMTKNWSETDDLV